MANVKITELTNLTDPSTTDVMPVVDVDADVTKKVSVGEVVGKISGDVEVATDGTATISELPVSKLQDGAARQLLQTAANGTDVEWTDDVDLPGTLDVTGVATLDDALNVAGLASLDGGIDVDGAFTVADTSGNVATSGTLGVSGQSTLASAAVSDLTSGRVVLAGASGEIEDSGNLTFNGSELGVTGTLDVSSDATVGGDLTVVGDLTVEGATTTLETQTVTVEDKNIELGVVDTPSDTTADGGGITLKGDTDKTINWVDATDAWTFSEHVELASGKEFYIDGNGVLNATTLGSGVVNSSLTSVGTIATGTWQGTAIDATYLDPTVVTTDDNGTVTSAMISDGTIVNADVNASAAIADTKLDTISTAGKVSNSATTATDANTANAIVARDASGDFTAGTITADLTGNADTATALETAREIGGVSFDGTANINLPGVNTTGNQDTSGNAATATKLDSSRTFAVTGDVTGTVSSDLTSGASIATSIASGVIVDADVNASAAIAGTKIDPDFGSQSVETTGVFSAAGGAEATPSIAFTGDLNTGIYSPGADQLAISTNGTGRLFVDSVGRVGLGGASSPVDDFHISTSNPSIVLEESDAGTDEKYWRTRVDNGAYIFEGLTDAFGSPSFWLRAFRATNSEQVDNIQFATSNSERLRITSDGKLGLGTSSPSEVLHVQTGNFGSVQIGADGPSQYASKIFNPVSTIKLESTASDVILSSARHFIFQDETGSQIGRWDANGRLGIGTTSPNKTLTVTGDVLATAFASNGNLEFNCDDNANNAGNDAIIFKERGNEKMRMDGSGRLLVGTSSESGGSLLQVNDNRIRIASSKTPASASDTGAAGEICWDSSYIYVCTATDTWKRAALSTW